MNMTTSTIELGSARAEISAPSQPSGIGVLLYPTIFGIDPPMRHFAADLVARNHTVAIWDPYDGTPVSVDVMEMVGRSKAIEDDRAIGSLTRVVDHMRDALGLGQIVGIGWCFGGRIGLLHAGLDSRVAALSTYNPTILSPTPIEIKGVGVVSRADNPGQTMDEFDLARKIAGPVQVTRPAHDFTQPAEYEKLVAALFAREAPTFYEYYPGVGHGFSYTPGEANEQAQRYAWSGTVSLIGSLAPVG